MGIGFVVIFMLGICLVLTAGFSSTGSGSGRRKAAAAERTITALGGKNGSRGSGLMRSGSESSSFLRALFGRFQRQSSFVGLRGQHYSCQYTPQRHLDSSFDTEEEEEEDAAEDELFSQQVQQKTNSVKKNVSIWKV